MQPSEDPLPLHALFEGHDYHRRDAYARAEHLQHCYSFLVNDSRDVACPHIIRQRARRHSWFRAVYVGRARHAQWHFATRTYAQCLFRTSIAFPVLWTTKDSQRAISERHRQLPVRELLEELSQIDTVCIALTVLLQLCVKPVNARRLRPGHSAETIYYRARLIG